MNNIVYHRTSHRTLLASLSSSTLVHQLLYNGKHLILLYSKSFLNCFMLVPERSASLIFVMLNFLTSRNTDQHPHIIVSGSTGAKECHSLNVVGVTRDYQLKYEQFRHQIALSASQEVRKPKKTHANDTVILNCFCSYLLLFTEC